MLSNARRHGSCSSRIAGGILVRCLSSSPGSFHRGRPSCTNGHLDLAKWIYASYGSEIPFRYSTSYLQRMFPHLIIRESIPPECQTVRQRSEGEWRDACLNAFGTVCVDGNLEVAKWMRGAFRFTSKDLIYRCSGRPFITVCGQGDIEMAKWLIDALELTVDDIRCHGDQAFAVACSRGHLEVAQMLHSIVGYVHEDFVWRYYDIEDGYGRAGLSGWGFFQVACEGGHLGMVKWLTETFNVSYPTLFVDCVRAANSIEDERDRTKMIEWLRNVWVPRIVGGS